MRLILLRLACPLLAVMLVSCPRGMPQHMVLELGERKAPIRSVLVLRDSSRPSGENVSIVFHEDELDCASVGPAGERGGPARGATLAVRGLGPEFGRDERKPPLWHIRASADGAETAFAFGDPAGGGGRHALRVTRSGKTTAYGEIDLEAVADGLPYRLTGTFDAAICY